MGINIKAAAAQSEDSGNTEVLDRNAGKTIRLMMFGTSANGEWAAERNVRKLGIPLREMEVKINRKGFQYVVGQPLRVSYASRNISEVVFRIMNVKESASDSETVTLQLLEDADYLSSAVALLGGTERGGSQVDYTVQALTDIRIIENPYAMAGEEIQLLPLFGRKKGTEIGYQIYHSLDGTTYTLKGTGTSYAVYGVTVNVFDWWRSTTDKVFNLIVDFDLAADAAGIGDLARAEVITGKNLALLCSGATEEIFCFDTIEPEGTVAGRMLISGFIRGRYDTPKQHWPIGSEVYFVGLPRAGLTDANYLHNSTRYFKFVPYNSKAIEDITNSIPITHLITSRAFCPYIPGNLRLDGKSDESIGGCTYSFAGSDSRELKLMWSPRIRGAGAGLGNPDELTDAYPTWEGYFEVFLYDGATLAATTTPVSGISYSYSESALRTAFGGTPDNMTIKVRNSILTSGTVYSSNYNILNAARV